MVRAVCERNGLPQRSLRLAGLGTNPCPSRLPSPTPRSRSGHSADRVLDGQHSRSRSRIVYHVERLFFRKILCSEWLFDRKGLPVVQFRANSTARQRVVRQDGKGGSDLQDPPSLPGTNSCSRLKPSSPLRTARMRVLVSSSGSLQGRDLTPMIS
jgi:hypothetical protein